MRTRLVSLAAAAFLVTAGAAASQGIEHKGTDLTFGYDDLSASIIFAPGDFGGETRLARARSDWGFGGRFGTQFNLDYSEISIEGSDSPGITNLALHPYMEFGSSGRAGLFFQRSDFENFSENLDYYGVEGMFTPMPQLTIEGYAGVADGDNMPFDVTTFGTTVYYAFAPNLGARMAYDYEDISDGGFSASNSRFNFGIDYYLGGNGSMMPIVLTAEVGTVDAFGFVDVNVIGAKVTIPLGSSGGAERRQLYRERGILWAVLGGGFGP